MPRIVKSMGPIRRIPPKRRFLPGLNRAQQNGGRGLQRRRRVGQPSDAIISKFLRSASRYPRPLFRDRRNADRTRNPLVDFVRSRAE